MRSCSNRRVRIALVVWIIISITAIVAFLSSVGPHYGSIEKWLGKELYRAEIKDVIILMGIFIILLRIYGHKRNN